MVTSVLDIVDTAVKIGLGAAITSISSLFLSKHSHERDAQKERIKKERELLEKIAEEFESFSYSVLSYWALITEWNRFKLAEKPMPENRKKLLDEAKREYFLASRELTSAEAKLLLLAQGDAQQLLRVHADLLREFRRKIFERDTAYGDEELKEWREKILASRKNFFDSLSKSFHKL